MIIFHERYGIDRQKKDLAARITPAQSAKAYDASIGSFTDDGIISDKDVQLDVQLTKERVKLTKEIPLSQLVDWSLVKEIKQGH